MTVRFGTLADLIKIIEQADEEERMTELAAEALRLSMFAFISMHQVEYQRFIENRAIPAFRRIVVEAIPDNMAKRGHKLPEQSIARALQRFVAIVEPVLNLPEKQAEHYIAHFEAVERGEKMPHDDPSPERKRHDRH